MLLTASPRSPNIKNNNQRFVLLSVATSYLTRLKWTEQELFKASLEPASSSGCRLWQEIKKELSSIKVSSYLCAVSSCSLIHFFMHVTCLSVVIFMHIKHLIKKKHLRFQKHFLSGCADVSSALKKSRFCFLNGLLKSINYTFPLV